MNRTLCLVLFAGLCLAGCTRSSDPLDWKIEADDAIELEAWLGKNLPLMPRDLAGELSACLAHIHADTSGGPTGKQRAYRFSRRLDGHTVREALVEGHEIANRMMLVRITHESDAVVRLLNSAHTLGPEELRKHEKTMNAHLALRDGWQSRLKESEKRVTGLRAAPLKD